MKPSWKIFNIIFSLIILGLIGTGFYFVNSYNTSAWSNRIDAVTKSGEYAVDSFYSYPVMSSGSLSESGLKKLSEEIKTIADDSVDRVSVSNKQNRSITEKFEYSNDLQRVFISENKIILFVFVCVDYTNNNYYITLESDFTDLSNAALRNWRIFAWGAAGLLVLSAALLVIINLLKKESEKNRKFMENFAHELKTPMTSILGYSSMMSTYDLDESERIQALGALTFEAKRLDQLSKQMLELFVIQKERPEMLPVTAEKLADALDISLKELSEKYAVPYSLYLQPAVMECNEILVLSMITNLCDNAFKATVNGMPVDVSGRIINGKYKILVADQGIGISRKNISRIMEPFFREDKARARKLGGAGLGLSLCSEIAKIHGTKLMYKSARGKGTKVAFELKVIGDNFNGFE